MLTLLFTCTHIINNYCCIVKPHYMLSWTLINMNIKKAALNMRVHLPCPYYYDSNTNIPTLLDKELDWFPFCYYRKAIPSYAPKSGEENIYEEMEDKQYAYVSFPVVEVPLEPPRSMQRTEIKENLNPEDMSPDSNPAYHSSGGDMMEDISSMTREYDDELIDNPMYGESSGGDMIMMRIYSLSITKENDD